MHRPLATHVSLQVYEKDEDIPEDCGLSIGDRVMGYGAKREETYVSRKKECRERERERERESWDQRVNRECKHKEWIGWYVLHKCSCLLS